MMETEIIFFLVTSLILIITPGQDMILVMSRSITQGSKAVKEVNYAARRW